MGAGTYQSRGLRLAYEEAGQGPALLLLHAFPFSRSMWGPLLAALSPRFRCIAPDAAGFGESEPDPSGICHMTEMAQDAEALLDHLEVPRAVVCGLSMGGYAALALQELAPDRLSGLVLADTRAGADSEEGRAARLASAEKALAEGSAALAADLVPKLLSAGASPELRRQVEDWIAAAPPAAVAAAQRGMAARPDRTALLPYVDLPALVVVGEEDVITPPAEARRMAEAIPGAILVTIPGAGHLSNLEQPEAFQRAVGELLDRLPTQP